MDKDNKLVETIHKINRISLYSDDEKEKFRSRRADNHRGLIRSCHDIKKFFTFEKTWVPATVQRLLLRLKLKFTDSQIKQKKLHQFEFKLHQFNRNAHSATKVVKKEAESIKRKREDFSVAKNIK